MLSHVKVDKISTGMIHLGLNADCWVQQNSLQLHDAPIPDQGIWTQATSKTLKVACAQDLLTEGTSLQSQELGSGPP